MKKYIITICLVFLSAAITTEAYAGYCLNANKGFKTSSMIKRYLTDLAANSSGYAVVKTIGKSTGMGKDITAILITENASWEDNRGKNSVVITGAIHGNEWATPEVCIGIAEYLLENKDNDEPARDDRGLLINEGATRKTTRRKGNEIIPEVTSIKELLKRIQVIIIPVLNPDGYDFSYTDEGRRSFYGAGWRENLRRHQQSTEVCYQRDGTVFPRPPRDAEHCFLGDYDLTSLGGGVDEESVIICESIGKKEISLFQPTLEIDSKDMLDAIYSSDSPRRVFCTSPHRRVWKHEWSADNNTSISFDRAKAEGYLRDALGVDLNRNFRYKWDVVKGQEHLFIRTRSYASRLYRGDDIFSENETRMMERLVKEKNVVALIDYHSGSTQVLYPYAYTKTERVKGNFFSGKTNLSDYEVFRFISKKIASILNRHDRGDSSIVNFTTGQNYLGSSLGSGVARDCYYSNERIAALNIEVHDRRYTYEDEEYRTVVPKICKTNVPGAIWFLFWAVGINQRNIY